MLTTLQSAVGLFILLSIIIALMLGGSRSTQNGLAILWVAPLLAFVILAVIAVVFAITIGLMILIL